MKLTNSQWASSGNESQQKISKTKWGKKTIRFKGKQEEELCQNEVKTIWVGFLAIDSLSHGWMPASFSERKAKIQLEVVGNIGL